MLNGLQSSPVLESCRVVKPTSLARHIMAAILDEILPADLMLFDIAVDPLVTWEEQQNISDSMTSQ